MLLEWGFFFHFLALFFLFIFCRNQYDSNCLSFCCCGDEFFCCFCFVVFCFLEMANKFSLPCIAIFYEVIIVSMILKITMTYLPI